MEKMITTSNTDVRRPLPDGIKEKTLEDGTVVLESTKPLKTITTGKVRPRTKLEGEETKNYYPPLTTGLLHKFKNTVRGRKARDLEMEVEADKKRVADGVPPVLKKGGTGNKK